MGFSGPNRRRLETKEVELSKVVVILETDDEIECNPRGRRLVSTGIISHIWNVLVSLATPSV